MTVQSKLKRRIKKLISGTNRILEPLNRQMEKIIPEGKAIAQRKKTGEILVAPTKSTMSVVEMLG